MKPTVGRNVHFVATGGEHRAAMVTEVADNHPLSAVHLCVFNPDGIAVAFDTPWDDDGTPGTWHWPEREA